MRLQGMTRIECLNLGGRGEGGEGISILADEIVTVEPSLVL
jgi:hypothetical protein